MINTPDDRSGPRLCSRALLAGIALASCTAQAQGGLLDAVKPGSNPAGQNVVKPDDARSVPAAAPRAAAETPSGAGVPARPRVSVVAVVVPIDNVPEVRVSKEPPP